MTKLEVCQIQDYYKAGASVKEIAEKLNIQEKHIELVIKGKAKEDICLECGKKFYKVLNFATCSEECRKKRIIRQQKENFRTGERKEPVKKAKKKKITVREFAKLAEEQGLTYGQLQARETLGILRMKQNRT